MRASWAGVLAAALLLAGCVGNAPEAATLAPAVEAPAVSAVPVAREGTFGVQFVACPVVTCAAGTLPGAGANRFFEVEGVTATAVDVNLTATWSAGSPTMRDLRLGVATCVERCRSDADIREMRFIDGPSPLSFAVEGFAVPEGERLFVFLWLPSQVPAAYAVVTTPQPVKVEGTVLPGREPASA